MFRWMQSASRLFAAIAAMSAPMVARVCAQEAPQPIPVAGAANLMRLAGVDPGSGVQYVRLLLSLQQDTASDGAPPRFTVECSVNRGKRDLAWFVTFGGVDSYAFEPPFHATQTDLFPPRYPSVNLKMIFEGYTKSKPFVRSWSLLPSGELRYRNPGLDSPNMESARFFMQFLTALPGLRLRYAKPAKGEGRERELLFQTEPLLEEIKRSPECNP
jgi:hypothetical protein